MKALEWSQHNTLIFRRSMAANFVVGNGIWPKFKLMQAFIVVLVTCKNDPSNNEGTRMVTTVYGDFSRRSPQSLVRPCVCVCVWGGGG